MSDLDGASKKILEVWQQHTMAEFVHRDTDAALATMTDDAHVLLVPPSVGGVGKLQVRTFYAEKFLAQLPPDLFPTPISQTIGQNHLVEEAVYKFTHSIRMDWMMPGLEPTGKVVEVAVVGIITFRDGLVASEHLYWDQASVLVQLGLIQADGLPIVGAEGARRVLELGAPRTG
jgi:carboxymethylenebutenolidase